MVVVLLNMLIAMINNSYQEIEVRPVNWKCSLSLTLICIPVWGMMRVMMLEAHVLLIMSAEQTTGILPGLLQEAPPASQPQGMAHYTCNGPARAESVSWIFPLLHVPLRRACRGPMANWNDYLFPPTFTSASPMLFIKYAVCWACAWHWWYRDDQDTISALKEVFTQNSEENQIHQPHVTVQWGQCTQRSPSRCRRCRAETVSDCGEEACRGHSKTDFARQTKASRVYREAIYQNLKCMNHELLIAALFGTARNEKQTNWALIGI